MIILSLIGAHLLAGGVGYLFLEILDRNQVLSRGYKVFAGLLVGIGIFTLEIFTALVLGARVSLGLFLGITLGDILVLGIFALRFGVKVPLASLKRERSGPHPLSLSHVGEGRKGEAESVGKKIVFGLIALLLIVKLLASFWQVLHVPTYEFDAWNNWNLRPKVIFTEGKLPLDKNSQFYLGGGIKSYPLNDTLWKVFLAQLLGRWDERLINAISVFYYLILLGLFYFSLPQSWGRLGKLLGTYLLASLPFLYFHSWIPYVDLWFGAYLFFSATALYKFLRDEKTIWLWLSAIGLGLAIWTKNEGFAVLLPLVLGIVTVLSIAKKMTIKNALIFAVIALVVAGPWLVFRTIHNLDVLSGDSSNFKLGFNRQFLREWFLSVFIRSHFNFLWFLFFGLVVLKFKKIWQAPEMRYLSITIVLLFVFYNGIILFTDKAFDLSALVRVNLHIAPLALLAVLEIIRREFLYKSE